MTKISRGQRAHLLALCGVTRYAINLRDLVSGPAKRMRYKLKKLERSMRKAGGAFVEMSGAVNMHERMRADAHRDVSAALLAGVYR
jgi:hypothetical protein